MDLKPILATTIGIAIARGIVAPALSRYVAWKNGPRVSVARRNWRGVYVPDLTIKRAERLFWLTCIALVIIGGAVGWTVMTSSRPPAIVSG